jgi:hypothetical protein
VPVLAIRHSLFLAIHVANCLCHFVKQVSFAEGGLRVSEISYQAGKMEKKNSRFALPNAEYLSWPPPAAAQKARVLRLLGEIASPIAK